MSDPHDHGERDEHRRGHWIGDGSAPDCALHRLGFRRDVHLADPPAALTLRITADSRYVLWVNGVEVGRGPGRSQPARWLADAYDIGPRLRPGANAIAVLVTYYGESNAFWQRARVIEGLGSNACLNVDVDAPLRELSSDAAWHVTRFDAWSSVANEGELASLPVEILDLRRLDPDWTTREPGAGFAPASLARAGHAGAAGRSVPPVYPYGPLRESPLAPLGGETVVPRAVVGTILPALAGAALEARPIAVVHEALLAAGRPDAWDAGISAHPGGTTCEAGPEERVLVLHDFGRIVSGLVELGLEAPEGSVLDLAGLERPLTADADDRRYVPRAGARLIAAAGPRAFTTLETNGLRYLAVLVSPAASGTIRLDGVRVREQLAPWSGASELRSSDPSLEQLWRAGVRTVAVNSSDAFTDCPTRERRAWVGDAVVAIEVHLVANADWRLVEHHLELADSPRADGLLPMSVVGDIEDAGRHSIPDWSLHWVHALWLYARHGKRDAFVRRRMPSVRRVLAWFEPYLTDDGVLCDVPEWTLGDWSSVFTEGRSSLLTALWARALREYAELSEWLGNDGDARDPRALAGRVRAGFEQFWDPERGVYVDHIVDGERRPAASQAANAAAIVAGLVDPVRAAELIERITDERWLVTRGWNAPSPTVDLATKMRDRAAGVRRIDWDVAHEMVRAEPFFASVVHDAVAHGGRADLLPRLLQRWMRFLVDGYDTFGECWEWGTPAHAWSSAPTRDIVVHLLGVSPAGLSDPRYRIAPARIDVERLSVTVPTRDGPLYVERRANNLRFESPVPVLVCTWDGGEIGLPAGAHEVDLLKYACVG